MDVNGDGLPGIVVAYHRRQSFCILSLVGEKPISSRRAPILWAVLFQSTTGWKVEKEEVIVEIHTHKTADGDELLWDMPESKLVMSEVIIDDWV